MDAEEDPGRQVQQEVKVREERLRGKADARARVLALVSEGLFGDDEIKRELRRIEEIAADDEKQLAELRKISTERETRVLSLDWAGRLLGDLRSKLQTGELTFEKKRKFIETLVAGIKVTPGEPPEVTFRFDSDFSRAQSSARTGLVPTYTGTAPP
jgi:hypothetical protein